MRTQTARFNLLFSPLLVQLLRMVQTFPRTWEVLLTQLTFDGPRDTVTPVRALFMLVNAHYS